MASLVNFNPIIHTDDLHLLHLRHTLLIIRIKSRRVAFNLISATNSQFRLLDFVEATTIVRLFTPSIFRFFLIQNRINPKLFSSIVKVFINDVSIDSIVKVFIDSISSLYDFIILGFGLTRKIQFKQDQPEKLGSSKGLIHFLLCFQSNLLLIHLLNSFTLLISLFFSITIYYLRTSRPQLSWQGIMDSDQPKVILLKLKLPIRHRSVTIDFVRLNKTKCTIETNSTVFVDIRMKYLCKKLY